MVLIVCNLRKLVDILEPQISHLKIKKSKFCIRQKLILGGHRPTWVEIVMKYLLPLKKLSQ